MKNFMKGTLNCLLISLSFGSTSLLASDNSLDASCQNRARLYHSGKCNPYKVSLIPVDLSQTLPQKRVGTRLTRKNLTLHTPPRIQRELSLQDLVDRYINREEKLQLEQKQIASSVPEVPIVPLSSEEPNTG